jgi:hypothetical protein
MRPGTLGGRVRTVVRVSSDRSTREVDDNKRVERFLGSMLLMSVLAFAAGIVYVGWYAYGPR